ncbi:MFS transporter, partial [Escherichia coli]|nr:MFS transporter [Escherichia coli]
EVFAEHEYRAVFAASTLTWVGDYVAKAAVTLLVYRETESVALSAAAFAVSYLPWLVGGPLLATLAERHRFRRVMVACDLIRMALMLLVAIPGMP